MRQDRVPEGPRVYIDMDGVVADYDAHITELTQNNPADRDRPQSEIAFWTEMPTMSFDYYDREHSWRHDPHAPMDDIDCWLEGAYPGRVFFLSSPSTKNTASWTGKACWIEKHFGFETAASRLILTTRKDLLYRPGDFLIDDNIKGHGQEVWRENGALIHFGSIGWPDWEAIATHIETFGAFNQVYGMMSPLNTSGPH